MKLKGISRFEGMNISSSKVITLNVKMGYEEVVTSVQLLQGLNSDITVLAKLGIGKPKNLGMFKVNGINFDKDGNAKISLKSLTYNVELDNVMEVVNADNEEILQLLFKTIIELPDNEEMEDSEYEDDEEELPFK